MAENLSVSWEEYRSNICQGLGALQQRGEFVDMTLAADGHHVKVHQMIMSLVSPFIKDLITTANCPHPVIFLNRVSYQTMQSILEYAYTGEVVVRMENMKEFLEACKDLHIKGLETLSLSSQKTACKIVSEGGTERDKPEIEREDDSVQSNNKRKRCQQEEVIEEIVELDDDFHHADETQEVQESILPEWSPHHKENKASVESANHTQNVPKKVKPAPLQYSVSCQGNLQVIVNRYLYALRYMRKNDQRFWRCISQQSTNCPAIITTKDDRVVERSSPHNHPFHDAQILKRLKHGNMFTKLNEVENAAATKRRNRQYLMALNETRCVTDCIVKTGSK